MTPRPRDRRGAATVEFAFVAPLFFALVIGMIEYGQLVRAKNTLTSISRDMARVAVVDGATAASVEAYRAESFRKAGITQPIRVTWEPANPDVPTGTPITAVASIPYTEFCAYPTFLLRDFQVRCETTMRKEGVD